MAAIDFEWEGRKESANQRKHGVKFTEAAQFSPTLSLSRLWIRVPRLVRNVCYHSNVWYRQGTNIVLLDPEVSRAFPDSKSANDALRALLTIASRTGARKGM